MATATPSAIPDPHGPAKPKPGGHHERGQPRPELGPVDLPQGKIVARRWKVVDKLGEGGCGAVYLVEDQKTKQRAALKAESNFVPGGSVLKLEVQVLRRLSGRQYVAQLITSGKKEKYSYMVMTLFGPSLSRLFKYCKREFTISTQVRLGMQMLYGLKQLHEVGYVHRDLKPANLAVGVRGKASRVVHLLDFGLSREYIIKNEKGRPEMRRPRENTLFRGTTKYCSSNSHKRAEQGRPDDLWSMVYVLAEMRGPLPWDQIRDKHEIGRIKKSTSDDKLLAKCPYQMKEIANHLRELTYFNRPDYQLIYTIFEDIMHEHKIKFSDPLDWEILGYGPNAVPPAIAMDFDKMKPGKMRKKISRIQSVAEDPSVHKTSATTTTTTSKAGTESKDASEEGSPFNRNEFDKNEMGF
uniref:Protein kinase domain-containing protein n=1 Tax=Panagrellus redivivus TaxID=6233 RepID=A0A7E4ZUJ5_PANRE